MYYPRKTEERKAKDAMLEKLERANARDIALGFREDRPRRLCVRCEKEFKPRNRWFTRCSACNSGSQYELVEVSRYV